jgi:hypothetical protein
MPNGHALLRFGIWGTTCNQVIGDVGVKGGPGACGGGAHIRSAKVREQHFFRIINGFKHGEFESERFTVITVLAVTKDWIGMLGIRRHSGLLVYIIISNDDATNHDTIANIKHMNQRLAIQCRERRVRHILE